MLMKVTQEKLPASQIGLEIEIESDVSKKEYERTIREYTQNANIPGFRRGKVPRQVLIQRLGASRIKATVLEKLIQDNLERAIKQEEIEVLGNLQLRSSFEELVKQFKPGEPITISASVDIPPDVSLEEYTGFSVQAEEIKYDESRVDSILEDYRSRTATLVPIEDRAAQSGDTATVDFEGTLVPEEDDAEPQPIPGGSAEDFQIELEDGQFIPGFVDGIVGMNAGETKTIAVTFPDNYPQADVAGKAASFTVTMKEIKEKELPDLDDDFAQDVSEFETLDELRESLTSRLKDEAEQKTKDNTAAALITKLVEMVVVDPPESMVKQEADLIVNQAAMQLQQQGIDVRKVFTQDLLDGMRDNARPEAITRIKQRLSIQQVGEQESIKVSEDAIDSKVKEFVEQYGDRDIDMGRLRGILEEDLLQEQVLDWLAENNTVELVPEGSLSQDEDAEESSQAAAEADGGADVDNSADADSGDTAVDAADVTIDVEAKESEDTDSGAKS